MKILPIFALICCFLILAPLVSAVNIISVISVDTSTPVIGDQFSLSASISGALSGSIYFVKCRLGSGSSSLSEGETYNLLTVKWLSDSGPNGAWVDMPQGTVNTDGIWQGTITCRIKSDSLDEAKVIYARACLNSNGSCGSSFQSANFLTLNPQVPTPTPTSIPTPSSTPVPTNTPKPTSTPAPENTTTPTKIYPTNTIKPTTIVTITPIIFETATISSESSVNVMGESDEAIGQSENTSSPYKNIIIGMLLSALGLSILMAVLIWQKRNAANLS